RCYEGGRAVSSWRPEKSWTGQWCIPPLLEQPVTERERGAIVAMSKAGFGPRRLAEALEKANSVAEAVARFANQSQRALGELHRLNMRAVLPCDEEYPALLRQIVAPPPLLYVRGEPLNTLKPCVAIVGARACTSGGAQFAHRLGEAI